MNAATISALTTSEINGLLIQMNDALNAARSAFRNDTAYIARVQPTYDALLAEWRARNPSSTMGVSIG